MECTKFKCNTVMKHSKCQKCRTAKVSVTDTDGKSHSLTIFNDVISDIIGNDPARALVVA